MSGFELLLGTAVAGAALETVGGILSAEEDSKIARANAIQTRAEAVEEAGLEAAEGRRLAAKAKTRAAASGVTADGSALDVIGELEAEGQFRARSAIHRGQVRYDSYRATQKNAKKGKVLAIAGGAAKIGTTLLTAGLFSGAGAAADAAGAASGGTKAVASGWRAMPGGL